MKKLIATLCFLTVLGLGALSAADKVEGLWKSINETGKVTGVWKIYQQNNLLYGALVTVPGQTDATIADKCKPSYPNFPVAGEVNKMLVINTPFIFGLKMKAPGKWEGGNIIDAGDGTLYQCKINFRAADGNKYKVDTLEMRGEIGLGIGKSQLWVATTPEEIEAIRFK